MRGHGRKIRGPEEITIRGVGWVAGKSGAGRVR